VGSEGKNKCYAVSRLVSIVQIPPETRSEGRKRDTKKGMDEK
jgi:hypothetical protein